MKDWMDTIDLVQYLGQYLGIVHHIMAEGKKGHLRCLRRRSCEDHNRSAIRSRSLRVAHEENLPLRSRGITIRRCTIVQRSL